MSAVTDILLAPDVRPFAIAAAIMVTLGGIEMLTMIVGFSISELIGQDFALEAASHNAIGGLFLWINAGRLPLLILIILALGIFSIAGFLLQGIAHGVGMAVPVARRARGRRRQPPRRSGSPAAASPASFRATRAMRSTMPISSAMSPRFRSARSTRACPAASVSRMSSATGTVSRRAPVPIPPRSRSAPASCWSTATPKASSPFPHPPTSLHTNNHHPRYKKCGNLQYPSRLAFLPSSSSASYSPSSIAVRRVTKPMSAPASAARRSCSTAARSCFRSSIRPRPST